MSLVGFTNIYVCHVPTGWVGMTMVGNDLCLNPFSATFLTSVCWDNAKNTTKQTEHECIRDCFVRHKN